MKLLLVSDTHGHLDIINSLAEKVGADAVLHAGDFGFYDDQSYDHLSRKELQLTIRHSSLSDQAKKKGLDLPYEGQVELARRHRLLGDFPDYLHGAKDFIVPVYAVWGNHEDRRLIEELRNKTKKVQKLHLVDEKNIHTLGPVQVLGLGGNFISGKRFLQRPIAGGAGKVWSTLSQYFQLVQLAGQHDPYKLQIFLSHVSPGKEPFVECIAACCSAQLTVSGHMGAAHTMIWNPFSVHTQDQASDRIKVAIDGALDSCDLIPDMARQQLAVIRETFQDSLREKEASWYRGMKHVNLPDADVGYATITIQDTKMKIAAFTHHGA